MRKEKGVFVLDSKEMKESKFDGVMVSKIDVSQQRKHSIIAQKCFYDDNGKYQKKDITVISFEKDELNVETLIKIVRTIVKAMKPEEKKIPEIAISEDVMQLIK